MAPKRNNPGPQQVKYSVKILQRQMGHTSASLTLDIYGFLFPERLGQVADVIDAERTTAIVSKRD